jgi:hypothetical protein
MKRCPSCQRTYTDDTLRFCLEDGATLLSSSSASGSSDPMAATLLDSPPRNTGGDSSNRSAPTEVLQSPQTSNNQATPTRSWGTPNVAQPPPNSWDAVRQYPGQKSAPLISSPAQEMEKKRSWPGVVSLMIGILTWLMIALSFVGAGFKMQSELIGFLFLAGMFVGIFGVVFGAVAFGIAFKNPDRFGGKGFALIGLFMSLMPALFVLLLIVIGIAVSTK